MPRGRRRRRRRAIVNLLALVAASLIVLVQSALPPGQEDEIIVIDHLPGRRVHLQDFFWTGAEDAPAWLDPDQTLTIYETRTVHHTATVYVPEEASRGAPDPGDDRPRGPVDCASCIEPTATYLDVDQNIGVLVDGDDPGPRYWLLTVLRAGEDVPPKVELRLARLYKAAFTRQQQKHLGLLGSEVRKRKSPKREALAHNETALEEASSTQATSAAASSSSQRPPSGGSLLHMRSVRISKSERTLPLLESQAFEELALGAVEFNETRGAREDKAELRRSDLHVGLVQVRMQNTSRTEGGATRLIYTVHLGGKPVPAETAAKDMALLSSQEVALELGAPVIVSSEPLSRRRDAWLLAGAASLGFLLIALIVLALFVLAKRKRARSAVSAPTRAHGRRMPAKDEELPAIDNAAYTPDTDPRTEGTGRTPGSQDTMEVDPRGEICSENELDQEHHRRTASQQQARAWDSRRYAEVERKGASRNKRGQQHQRPRSGDSVDSAGMLAGGALEAGDSNARASASADEEEPGAPGSPHSYLSMPSCKQFPSMRSVEPLSKVLEPVVVKHLDLELDSPEMKIKQFDYATGNGDSQLVRSASETKDPGVLGPIVWDMKRKRAVEDIPRDATKTDGRRRRQKHSWDLDAQLTARWDERGAGSTSSSKIPSVCSVLETRGRAQQQRRPPVSGDSRSRGERERRSRQARVRFITQLRGATAQPPPASSAEANPPTHVTSPNADGQHRPRTSLPDGAAIPETGQHLGPQPRGAWGSRPLSAGPFHRPNLPEVEVSRILADSQLRPEDPAVPLISAINKELGRLTYE